MSPVEGCLREFRLLIARSVWSMEHPRWVRLNSLERPTWNLRITNCRM